MTRNGGKHIFHFRRFSITDSRSAMKIGTDGVLLGAWADGSRAHSILDVGTGCGLIALMMAQRFPLAQIDAIDIDFGAYEDALENFTQNPFQNRLKIFRGDFLYSPFPYKYDFIISNPPFFAEDTLSPNSARASARSACSSLPYEAFVQRLSGLLHKKGKVAVIHHYAQAENIIRLFHENGLYLWRRTDIQGSPNRPVKRSLMEFSAEIPIKTLRDTLCLSNIDGSHSAAYRALTGDFHPE